MSNTRRNLWIAFGIVLPILCFAFDPGVMSGDFSYGPMLEAPLFVYGVAGLGMAAMLVWVLFGGHYPALDAGIAGVLSVAGVVAALVGLCILPFSIFGLFLVIGVFGFVPFGTAWACFDVSRRALATARGALTVLGAIAVLGLASGYQLAGNAHIDRTIRVFRSGADAGAKRASVRELAALRPVLPDRVIGRRFAGSFPWDQQTTDEFAGMYAEVTGTDLRLWGRMGGD